MTAKSSLHVVFGVQAAFWGYSGRKEWVWRRYAMKQHRIAGIPRCAGCF
ncbi:hypothetical protein HMPREF9098_1971 [Kingella denitrificans ATCC 33394]|uniref:Uncharacterized protein n=1 Tax=Kingella denitrificans ATCC 33394 TaxID=888741 RepID=F0F1I6_9NEIS|nr:hypothetical protein HMPREF9098_1971 [Kingella denitrificans ATCC 33394]